MQQKYWNEYDDGSEAGDVNEPYMISIDPRTESSFPGAKIVSDLIHGLGLMANVPLEKIQSWLRSRSTSLERKPLFSNRQRMNSSLADENGTDIDDEASSSDYPSGYEAYYATFPSTLPSISEQKMAHNRERLLFHGTVTSFVAAFLLLFASALLVITGRHRLRVEVDAGAIVSIVASLFFAVLGFTAMLCTHIRLGLLYVMCVSTSFLTVCILSGFLLVLVMSNTRL